MTQYMECCTKIFIIDSSIGRWVPITSLIDHFSMFYYQDLHIGHLHRNVKTVCFITSSNIKNENLKCVGINVEYFMSMIYIDMNLPVLKCIHTTHPYLAKFSSIQWYLGKDMLLVLVSSPNQYGLGPYL